MSPLRVTVALAEPLLTETLWSMPMARTEALPDWVGRLGEVGEEKAEAVTVMVPLLFTVPVALNGAKPLTRTSWLIPSTSASAKAKS